MGRVGRARGQVLTGPGPSWHKSTDVRDFEEAADGDGWRSGRHSVALLEGEATADAALLASRNALLAAARVRRGGSSVAVGGFTEAELSSPAARAGGVLRRWARQTRRDTHRAVPARLCCARAARGVCGRSRLTRALGRPRQQGDARPARCFRYPVSFFPIFSYPPALTACARGTAGTSC